MKNIFLFLAALIGIGCFTACNNDEEAVVQNDGVSVTIRATIADDADTRVALGESDGNKTKVVWSEGDKFTLTVNNTPYEFIRTTTGESVDADFTCNDFPATFPATETITATYPTTEVNYALQDGRKEKVGDYITLNATREVTEDESTGNLNLTFKHNTSVVRMYLTNQDFKDKAVTVSLSATNLLADRTTITTTNEALKGDSNGMVEVYLVVPATAADKTLADFKITAVCDGINYEASLTATKLEAKKLYRVTKDMEKVDPSFVPEFSVSATKKVQFAPGNLRYTHSTQKWTFAENQYDVLFQANVTNPTYNAPVYNETTLVKDYSYTGESLSDVVDLFGWSGDNNSNNTLWGVGVSTDDSEYSSSTSHAFKDWGENVIDDYPSNTWRTLSKDEWVYLFYTRPKAADLFGFAILGDNKKGVILLPDNWTLPSILTFKSSDGQGLSWTTNQYTGMQYYMNSTNCANYANANVYTLQEWSELESAGAVFLPVTGYREGVVVTQLATDGKYWTGTNGYGSGATAQTAKYAFSFNATYLYPMGGNAPKIGMAVRLVKDLN